MKNAGRPCTHYRFAVNQPMRRRGYRSIRGAHSEGLEGAVCSRQVFWPELFNYLLFGHTTFYIILIRYKAHQC